MNAFDKTSPKRFPKFKKRGVNDSFRYPQGNHALVVFEDLKVANMSASARGMIDKAGRNVRQKTGLNKAILDQGWGEFRRMLEYKQ